MNALDAIKEVLKAKLGIDLDPIIIEDQWGDGDTEHGFITTYDVDMEKLNAEIDAFSASFSQHPLSAQDEVPAKITADTPEYTQYECHHCGSGVTVHKPTPSPSLAVQDWIDWQARAKQAESHLAEIQRGVEKLQGYDKARILVAYADVLALLQPQGHASGTSGLPG